MRDPLLPTQNPFTSSVSNPKLSVKLCIVFKKRHFRKLYIYAYYALYHADFIESELLDVMVLDSNKVFKMFLSVDSN